MNQVQKINIEAFRGALLEHASNGGRTLVEIKDQHIEEHGDAIELRIRVGMVGDKGTAAELYCRHFRQVFFGSRGRVTCRTVGKHGEIESVKINGFSESVRG
jgi:hypothetical protein